MKTFFFFITFIIKKTSKKSEDTHQYTKYSKNSDKHSGKIIKKEKKAKNSIYISIKEK